LAYLVPTFNGVKPNEVHHWYQDKLSGVFSFIKKEAGDSYDKASSSISKTLEGPRGIDKVAEMPMRSSKTAKRRGFTVAESIQPVDVLADEEFERLQPLPEVTLNIKEEQKESVNIEELKAIKETISISSLKKSPSLRYLRNVRPVEGIAIIHNANEIEIDGELIFLYGIYIDPESSKGIKAKDFLSNITERSTVNCQIVALTYQDVPTAICFVDELNINETLVKEGLSKDIVLGVGK
jgi:hypothetical protein